MARTALSVITLLAGLWLPLAVACTADGGVRNGNLPPPIGGNGAVDSGSSDGGLDGGDAGFDAGPVDAGPCVGSLQRPTVVTARDDCFSGGALRFPSLIDTACDASLFLDNILTCTGHLGGPLNAFTGACGPGAWPCTSPSIPGTLRCMLPDAGASCVIVLCDGSGDGGCSP